MLELYDGELPCDLYGVEGHQLRPIVRRVLDQHLDGGRGPIEVELNVLLLVVIVEPTLHPLDDVLNPLPHIP